jgi:hypothetical protein
MPRPAPWSRRVRRAWETLSSASAIAEQVVTWGTYRKAMRSIPRDSSLESHLSSEILCLFLCWFPRLCTFCINQKTRAKNPQPAHAESNRPLLLACTR